MASGVTPWWPAVLASRFWSEVLAAYAAALRGTQVGAASPEHPSLDGQGDALGARKVVAMVEFKTRRVS